MNKRIRIISIGLILTSVFASLALPVRTSAIIADFEETVAKQKAEAEAHVSGTVISTKYYADENQYDQHVDYKVKISKVYKGAHVNVGDIFELRHDCNKASEMFNVVPKSDCIKYSPKVGDKTEIYMNYGTIVCDGFPCPRYSQAVIYEDEILDDSVATGNYGNALFYHLIPYIGAAVLLAVIVIIAVGMIKKNKKHKK